ncbi:hypothetical protein U9M48_024795 [Paspalum notatum var. saurae]
MSKKHVHAPSMFGYSRDELLEIRKFVIGMLILTAALGQLLSSGALKLLVNIPLRRAISLCSPLAAVLLLAPSIQYSRGQDFLNDEVAFRHTMVRLSVFTVLFLAVLLLTICRLRFQRISKQLVHRDRGSKQRFAHRLIMNVCMLVSLVMVMCMHLDPIYLGLMLAYQVYSVVVVSFGNMQIPAAVLRVVLALLGLTQQDDDYADDNIEDKRNLAPSLNIFYAMVLGQGILYLVAYVLYIFSFIPRRSLARRGGFRGQWGKETVNLYHGYVLEKCMERDVLVPKKISLASFAMDSLNSDSPKMQLYGIRLMHNLLQMEATKTRLLARITTCAKTLARLISLLEWTNPRDTAAILFAAKVTAELAKSLRVVTIPGIIQTVSTLLDYSNTQRRRGNPLMETDDEQEAMHGPILNASGSQEERRIAVPNTSNQLETQGRSGQQVGEEEPQIGTDQDLFPALGMSILYNLAGCDQSNSEEIIKTTGLIPKIIGFTSYSRSETASTGTQGMVLVASSLQLLHRLTSIDGEIGIKLRHKVSKHAFLLQNLAKILQDRMSSQKMRKLAAGILRNLAVDGKSRQEIGCIQVIVMRLTQEFISLGEPSTLSTIADHLLRKVAGQALAMLAMESVHNCSVILEGAGHEFIKELTTMIHDDRYRCVAASLLRNMCLHAPYKLNESDLQALSYSVREVLERIMDAEGAELEILIGLSSQMCKVIPEGFARELEHGYIKDRFIRRLVDALNANMEPSAHYPGIRRAILEQVISMMEHDSGYVSSFNNCRMTETVSMVEETASKAENYSMFLGDAGVMEHREPLSSLVVRAKQFLNAGPIPQPSPST